MTNEEAIEVLNNWDMACPICEKRKSEEKGVCADCRFNNALNFAIKVLEERPQGEWIAREPYTHETFCPFCKEDTKDEVYGNFCPNCGADMRKGGAE